MAEPDAPAVDDLLEGIVLTDSARAVLSAYTGKMFVIRFRDLQDYVEKLFGDPVPLEMFGSQDFMASLSSKSEEDYLRLPEDVRKLVDHSLSLA